MLKPLEYFILTSILSAAAVVFCSDTTDKEEMVYIWLWVEFMISVVCVTLYFARN